jgi:aspartyl aminopeptidase
VLVDFRRPLVRIPNLAIHLFREIKTKGLKLNPQQHGVPVLGLEDAPELAELVVAELRAQSLAEAEPERPRCRGSVPGGDPRADR